MKLMFSTEHIHCPSSKQFWEDICCAANASRNEPKTFDQTKLLVNRACLYFFERIARTSGLNVYPFNQWSLKTVEKSIRQLRQETLGRIEGIPLMDQFIFAGVLTLIDPRYIFEHFEEHIGASLSSEMAV